MIAIKFRGAVWYYPGWLRQWRRAWRRRRWYFDFRRGPDWFSVSVLAWRFELKFLPTSEHYGR